MLSKFNNKKHRRLTALLLCVALMLGSVTSVSADISAADSETEVQNYAEEPTTEAVSYGAPEAQTEVQEGTPVAEETEAPAADTQQTEAHTEAATEAHTETAAETQAAETTAEQQVQKEASEETKVSEEVQLTQDMKNAEGKTICKVIADLPEGAFNADASEITMEVKAVSSEDEEAVVKLIKNALTENTSLGNFVMYHVSFKVNGQDAEPQKAVSVTFKDTELDVQDVKNATVFYYNPANSDAGNKDAELVPIIQRDELIKDLQKEEQEIPDNFDEIYDTSEITLTDKGAADEIQMDAWKNRIYGCYVIETTAGDTDADETAAEEPKTAINAIAAVAEDSANNGNVTLTESYGKLTASYTGSMSASDYKYVWYRSVNGGNAEVQKPVQYQDVNTGADLGQDISTDGTELYIALNGGALGYNGNTSVSYYVKVFEATDVNSDGTPKTGANALATSQSVSVTSYYELQNGSFEKPVFAQNWVQIANDSYKKYDGVWQTTGVDGAIEVINTDYTMDSAYRWYGKATAAEGKQFAELNCEAEGSLYQDVLTTPGETLNYQLAHRARGLRQNEKQEEDTMYVVIMPTQTAIEKKVTTQSQVQDVIANQKNYPGAMVVKYTDNDQAWTTHQGSYTVTASGQYSTRFFFVAGKTATNNVKEGNFLDDVKFTRSKLTPVEGRANVTVEKKIVGLEYATAYNLGKTLTFKIGNKTVNGSDMNWTWSNDGNTLTGSTIVTLQQNECGNNLKVEEIATGSLDVANYTRASSVTVDRTPTDGTSGTLSISTGESKSVAFRNFYTTNGGGSGDEPEASLSHEKYIKRNVDGTGTYDITLNASGTVGSKTNPAKVDIVLIVDTSGSMKNDGKLQTTKNAVKALVDVFNAKGDSVDVKYKLVTFAKRASSETEQWVDGNKLYDKVKLLAADGGTNYDQGFQKGKTAIDSARAEAKKVVIFLTDGKPTYYGTKPSGFGNATSTKTLTTALDSAATITCTDFYAVGIGLPDEVDVYKDDNGKKDPDYKDLTGQGVLDLIKNKVNAATKDAWNLTKDANGTYSSLTNKFQQIAGQTLTAACSNVVITDQLSDYVDVTDKSKLRVRVAERNTAGNYSEKYSQDFALDVTGNNAKVIVNDETIATVSYDAENKTATLDFTDSYKLKADYYYYLTITNVIPNETAFSEYAKNNYSYGTTVGDASTDEGTGGYFATDDANQATTGKITSSGQPGFFSNAKATVSYKNKESGSPITEEYAKPVVQVQIQTIPVKKVWSGAEPDDGTKILVQLVDQDGSPVDGKILELSKNNKWQNKLVVEKASKYDSYSYRELVADEKGSIEYKGHRYSMANDKSDIVINHMSYKVTYSYEGDTRVITNTKNDQSIKIVKQNNSGINLEGATFTLKDAQNQSKEYTSDENGIVFNNNINYGTYTLKEIKAPNGYALLNADITINVDQSGITVSGSDKVSVSEGEDGTYTVIVKNDMLYSLPSTGGSGIYWFSICGMLLMMAAAWIIYKNKCREVLVK